VLCAGPAFAQERLELTIETKNGTPEEEQAVLQLRRLVAEYEVERWLVTRDVLVDADAIPHSHPVLTVNTRYLENDPHQLTTLVHEQFHWWVLESQSDLAAAIREMEKAFPEVPVGQGRGARNKESTYLHLVVCDLEYGAMTQLVGANRAREVLEAQRHYTWIYDQVLNNPAVREINERHGMVVGDGAGSSSARS